MKKVIERNGITNVIEFDYFMVNLNLDMRADVQITFEIDGIKYNNAFEYKHRNEVNRFSVIGNTLEDIEEIRQGNKKCRIYLTENEVIEDILEEVPRYMYQVTGDREVLRKIENDDITVNIKIKNIEITEGYNIADSIKEAYKECVSSRELDVVNAIVKGIKKRTGDEMGMFSIEMCGSANRILIEGNRARVDNAELIRRKGGLCLYSKCGYRLFDEAEYTCLLVCGDDYELIKYKGEDFYKKDMYELFKANDDDTGFVRKLIVME